MSSAAAEYDRRAAVVRHLNVHYPVPEFGSLSEWKARARELRAHILACAGLLPAPERCPLTPIVTGYIEGDDYTIERVAIQTLPGFWLGGNLYRPKGKTGPFPGIANPHGHWQTGRIEHQELGSIPARCITFARMGCVAFAYDMIGYNDTDQVPHTFGGDREALWGISLGGLQLWNSIRVLDYLESLPDVDRRRLACTGASGGGTQTFLLSAVDDRVKVAAPVNMISLHMQGGCLCENMPNLRVDCTNVEIGALMAPRPLLMVAATGDWTKNTPTEEFPAIQSVYRLMGAEDRVQYVRFDAPHNYNLASREAVYAWFGRWLLGITDPEQLRERPFPLENPRDLRTFPGTERPEGRLGPAELTQSLIQRSEAQLAAAWPRDRESLRQFRATYLPVLRHSLGAEVPSPGEVVAEAAAEPQVCGRVRAERLFLGRKGRGERVPALLLTRADRTRPAPGVVAVSPEGIAGCYDTATGQPVPLIQSLLGKGRAVLLLDAFLTGESRAPESRAKEIGEIKFFTTYNRTDTDNRVQDILTALAYLRQRREVSRVQLVGTGVAGLWGLLACALDTKVEAAALDLAGFDPEDDACYLETLWVPGLRRAGDLRTAAALCAPRRLLLHGASPNFPAERLREAYTAAGKPDAGTVVLEPAGDAGVLAWLTR
ncbi:MAG: hypothetical protein GX774_07390 [Armatimonadetes bacterium]|nr:hypothetical protein [Armatimonadota bacterium]